MNWVATAQPVHARAAVVGAVARRDGAAALQVARALFDASPGIVLALGGSRARGLSIGKGSGRQPIMLPDGIQDAVLTVAEPLGRPAG